MQVCVFYKDMVLDRQAQDVKKVAIDYTEVQDPLYLVWISGTKGQAISVYAASVLNSVLKYFSCEPWKFMEA